MHLRITTCTTRHCPARRYLSRSASRIPTPSYGYSRRGPDRRRRRFVWRNRRPVASRAFTLESSRPASAVDALRRRRDRIGLGCVWDVRLVRLDCPLWSGQSRAATVADGSVALVRALEKRTFRFDSDERSRLAVHRSFVARAPRSKLNELPASLIGDNLHVHACSPADTLPVVDLRTIAKSVRVRVIWAAASFGAMEGQFHRRIWRVLATPSRQWTDQAAALVPCDFGHEQDS